MYAIHQSNFFITFINLGPGTFLLVKEEVLGTRLNSLVFGLFTTRTFFNSSLRLTLTPMKFSYFQRSSNNWTRSIMSDRATFSTQKCNFVQTRTYRSNSFGPSPQLGSHRSRRTLSLPAREKPIIPPVIAENPDSSQPIGEQHTMEEKFTKLQSKELEQPRPGYYRYEIGEQQLSLVKMINLWTRLSLGHHSCWHNKIFSSKFRLRQRHR